MLLLLFNLLLLLLFLDILLLFYFLNRINVGLIVTVFFSTLCSYAIINHIFIVATGLWIIINICRIILILLINLNNLITFFIICSYLILLSRSLSFFIFISFLFFFYFIILCFHLERWKNYCAH